MLEMCCLKVSIGSKVTPKPRTEGEKGILVQCLECLCGREDQKQAAVCVAFSLHHDAERKQRCTTGEEAAWKSYGVSLVHACPKLNEGTDSAAKHWCEVVDWTAGLH